MQHMIETQLKKQKLFTASAWTQVSRSEERTIFFPYKRNLILLVSIVCTINFNKRDQHQHVFYAFMGLWMILSLR